MPSTIVDFPVELKPYRELGILPTIKKGEKQQHTDCVFCGAERKFTIETATTKFRCFSCDKRGNATTFVREYYESLYESTENYKPLIEFRGIKEETLINWGLAYNNLTDEWLIPTYDAVGTLKSVCRYQVGKKPYAISGLGAHLFGVNLFRRSSKRIYLCEGVWDAMLVYELLGRKESVIGVPGSNTFKDDWASSRLFTGNREVVILYDSDHPKPQGKVKVSGGYEGVKKVTGLLTSNGVSLGSIFYLKWGKNGYDPDKPSGYDVGDAIKASSSSLEAFETIEGSLSRVKRAWLKEASTDVKTHGNLSCLPCSNYRTLVNAWKDAIHWSEGLDTGLSIMLACVMSTDKVGEQLWLKIIGPPSSGKTTLLEAISVSKKYVLAKDTIRGFYTGWQGTSDDSALAAKVNGMTLAQKDGDSLLKIPGKEQILSEARGLYDGAGRTNYRNATDRDYEGHRMTWLICGTRAIKELDESELGTRFLDYIIMDGIDEKFEDKVADMAGRQEFENMLMTSNGRPEERHNPKLVKAMQLTGGYVEYLRSNSQGILSTLIVDQDRLDKLLAQCKTFGKFISQLRSRPNKKVSDEPGGREFSPRLVKQLIRLSITLTAVLNKTDADEEVMERVRSVTIDTSRGITMELCEYLYSADEEGLTHNHLVSRTGAGGSRISQLLKHLYQIGVVRLTERKANRVKTQRKWKLTKSFTKLYREVMEG